MGKKIIIIVGILVLLVLIGVPSIKSLVTRKNHEKSIEIMYDALFTNERDLVDAMNHNIKLGIEQQEFYRITIMDSVYLAYNECQNNLDKLDELGLTGLSNQARTQTYYTTFYRDIKQMVLNQYDSKTLADLEMTLGKVMGLYNRHSNPDETEKKEEEIREFYYEINKLREELQNISM